MRYIKLISAIYCRVIFWIIAGSWGPHGMMIRSAQSPTNVANDARDKKSLKTLEQIMKQWEHEHEEKENETLHI